MKIFLVSIILVMDNEIGEEGGKAIGEALKSNTSLIKLKIQNNELSYFDLLQLSNITKLELREVKLLGKH